MLSDAYFLANFRFNTAENEPAKILQIFVKFAKVPATVSPEPDPRGASAPRGAGVPAGAVGRAGDYWDRQRGRSATRRPIGKISAKCCSFSAVSAPIFARKYAFCSIFQNLPDYQAEIFEIQQIFANFAT